MSRLLETALVAALSVGTAFSATLSDSLVREMRDNPGTTKRVLVFFHDAPGARSAVRSVRGDRAAGIQALRQNAALSQAAFLDEVGQGFGSTANMVSNWLANAIFMDATDAQIQAIADRADVKDVALDETIHLDPLFEVPAGKRAQGDDDVSTWGLKAIQALEAQAAYGVDGSGVIVGILDTGFDANHPELAGKLNVFKDFVANKADPYDDNGHGTHCAGTIGGGDGEGMEIGVAPGVKFVAGKIFSGGGSAQTEWIMNGMQWVVDPDGVPNSGDEPALVSNSWGGGPGRKVFLPAVQSWLELDIAPIFAAGNSGPGAKTVGTPGGFLESLAVGATTVNTTMASFSSRGPSVWDGVEYTKPDVSAPGKDVTSAKAGGGYWTISGTSMATPHVAGLAALLYQANPDLTVADLREVLEGTAIDHGAPGKDNDWGEGLVDAMSALAIVISGGKISGQVVDADGAPIAHAKLTVVERELDVRIKPDGSFKLTLPEGTYTLAAKAFGFTETSSDSLQVAAGETTEVTVTMDRAASGTVALALTGAGAPVEGSVQVLDTPLAAVDTDASGAASISLPAGTYQVMGRAYGFEMATSESFTVAAGETTQVALDLADLPPVLLVDDDKGKPYETYFQAALAEGSFKTVDYSQLTQGLGALELAQYETVVWFTGNDYQGSLTDADQAALAEYLDMGGRLLLSGQDLGYEIKNTAFYAERLQSTWKKDSADSKQIEGQGLSFAIEGGDGAGNQRYADVIEAKDGAEVFLSYGDGTTAAVTVAAGDSRVVYLAFGLEGVDTAENRKALMDASMAFLAPSTAEFARRLDAVQARQASGETLRFVDAFENLVATRVQSIGVDGDAGINRTARRAASFSQLFE